MYARVRLPDTLASWLHYTTTTTTAMTTTTTTTTTTTDAESANLKKKLLKSQDGVAPVGFACVCVHCVRSDESAISNYSQRVPTTSNKTAVLSSIDRPSGIVNQWTVLCPLELSISSSPPPYLHLATSEMECWSGGRQY